MSGLHGRFAAGLTSGDITSLRMNSQVEEQYGPTERLKQLVDRLVSTVDGSNLASLMKIADAGGLITATTVEAALQELATLGSGIHWKPDAKVIGLLGRKSVAQIDALVAGATKGDAYIANDAGTPGQGTSSVLVAGDITEWDGTSWIKIVSASGGFVPPGTVAIVGSGTLVGTGFTDVTDRNKVATFDGTTNAPTLTTPTDADARFITGAGSYNENKGFVYDSSPAGWNLVMGPIPYASATPAAVGTAAVGTSVKLAREDHVHAHGNQLGGTLHADVIAAGASGFMTGADKTKLDGVEALAEVTSLAKVATALGVTAAAAVNATNVGAGSSGKLLKLDSNGKAAGRVLETDGTKLDTLAKGNVSDSAPNASADTNAGYSRGSLWIDTSLNGGLGGAWICVDPTASGAIWLRFDGVPRRSSVVPAVNADQVTGTASETPHSNTIALASALGPARAGERFEFGFAVRVVGANGSDTLSTALKFGGLTFCTVPAADASVNDVIRAEGEFQIVTAGASGAIQGSGVVAVLFQSGPSMLAVPFSIHQESSVDLTTAAMSVTETWSTNSGTNKVNLVDMWLRRKALGT